MTDPQRICVSNAKGGTGKTTIAINVAGALNAAGNDVLFVDFDPQGNATEGLGAETAYNNEPPSLFDALTDPEARANAADIIVDTAEVDLLPSNVDMLHAERELTIAEIADRARTSDVDVSPADIAELGMSPVTNDVQPIEALSAVLDQIEGAYDHVIIDAPPFYGQLTDMAMYASGKLLIPTLTESTSERAIELLFDQIDALEATTDGTIEEVGVVANRVETTKEDTQMIEWLEAAFPDVPVWEVRKRVALQRAFSQGQSLFEYDPSVDMADVFADIAAELETNHRKQTEVPQ